MTDNKIRVLFITKGTEVLASSRYRVYELLPYLEKNNIETHVITPKDFSSSLSKKINYPLKIISNAIRSDIVYIQKCLFPVQFLQLLESVSKCIYDFDDALYASLPWSEGIDRKKVERLESTLTSVTAVITGSPVLSEYAMKYTDEIFCLPTAIPQEPYMRIQKEGRKSNRPDSVTIGWIGNPENLWYLSKFEDPIAQVLGQNNEARLDIITSGELPIIPFDDRDDVEYRKWSAEEELQLLKNVDIGIRPLINDEWTRGKGGFTSVVQLMAMKVPVVVSPVGMLPEIVSHNKNGYLARDNRDWVNYLNILIEDKSIRETMGDSSFEEVEKQGFWSEQRAKDLRRVLLNLNEK